MFMKFASLIWFASSLLLLPTQATTPVANTTFDATTKFELRNARVEWVDYRGRRALHLAPLAGHEHDTDQELTAVLVGSDFQDGVIEVDVAGARRQGYATDDVSAFKGFVGVCFRVQGESTERFYLRPENARLDSQLFRNRSTQYEASPDFSWQRLREEQPGKYESYVDLAPGEWTKVRIEVSGRAAKLFVGGASQPSLVVDDLKHGESRGAIALWTRISSDAYFSNLRVTPATAKDPSIRARAEPRKPGPSDAALPEFAEVLHGRTELVTYRGARAVKLVPSPESAGKDEAVLALLATPEFHDGTIQVDVTGAPRADAPADSRGFVGVSFRTGEHGEWSELLYLRPTNGRANDQLRRNRSVQYASHPDFPWHRLREEHPGEYESFVDLEPGVWTSLKIEVAGTTARLYVNDATQPCLVVQDLKRGDVAGRIALWAHVETDAYFGPVTVTRRVAR
ncbi:MAG: hypothetical protein K8S98_18725 [Planctomycetes bacterium]|nr:hypothetical protein [Planctomycetota bacterium]